MSEDTPEVESRLRVVEDQLNELAQAAQQSREVLRESGLLDPAAADTASGGEHTATASSGEGDSGVQPAYTSLAGWVEGFFAPTFTRPLGGEFRWCARWWDHAEALLRLRGLWASWEAARADPPNGMTSWIVYQLDPQLPILLSSHGPFARCDADKHRPDRPLPTHPAPPGLPS